MSNTETDERPPRSSILVAVARALALLLETDVSRNADWPKMSWKSVRFGNIEPSVISRGMSSNSIVRSGLSPHRTTFQEYVIPNRVRLPLSELYQDMARNRKGRD